MDENESPLKADHTEVTGRLRSESASGRRRLALKVVVAGAVGAFVFSGIALAAADVLPAPAQDVAHQALGRFGVHVPPGHQRFNDPSVCPGGPYRNHGAYVRTHKDDPEAGRSPCGKPVKAVEHPDAKDGKDDRGTEVNERPDGAGPPPWAHGNGKNKDQKDDKQKEPHKEKVREPAEDEAPDASTSTTLASTTTTSTSTTTTTSP